MYDYQSKGMHSAASGTEEALGQPIRRPQPEGYDAQVARLAPGPLSGGTIPGATGDAAFDPDTATAAARGLSREALDYNFDVVAPHQGRDHEAGHGRLPYRSPQAWNAQTILGNLTQLDRYQTSEDDQHRCFNYAFMAGFVIRGPRYIAALANLTAVRCQELVATTPAGDLRAGMQRHVDRMEGLGDRIVAQRGTYQDLAILTSALHRVGDPTSPENGSGEIDGQNMGAVAERAIADFHIDQDRTEHTGPSDFPALVGRLAPNIGYILGVQTGVQGGINHAVYLGQDARGAFLDDSFPRRGTQMMRWPSARNDILDYVTGPWDVTAQIHL